MKLYYDDILLGEIMTSHSMTIDEAIECLDVDMDDFAYSNGWEDWDYEELRTEV